MSAFFERRYPAQSASVPAARRALIDALFGAGYDDTDLHFEVGLTVTEAVANAVLHAYPPDTTGTVDIAARQTADGIVITVTDHGVGINTATSTTPGLGVGLPIMQSQTASLNIASTTSGTTITLQFSCQASPHQ